MNKFDLVKLVNEKPYSKNNLQKGMHGIVLSVNFEELAVLFFNPQNIGDYAVVNVSRTGLEPCKPKTAYIARGLPHFTACTYVLYVLRAQ